MQRYAEANNGYNYIFTFIDSFTKYAWARPAINKTSDTFAKMLKNHFYNEGNRDILHTDNGTEFNNALVNNICRVRGIRHIRGRPYHPQSQGQTERFNGTL